MAWDQSLLDQVFDRLAESNVADDVIDLVLAAYVGDAALDGVLAGEAVDLPERDPALRPRPRPLYLESITVAGFRGVGPQQALRLQPHAGLTLVVGRNGSGKSSYAEAVELALTGDSARWADRNSVFKDGWRNLHCGSPCEVEVQLRAEGANKPIRVRRNWHDEHTQAHQGIGSVLTDDGERYTETAEMGWREPLDTYRPFLTASDLGRLVTSTPSGLFDALAPILGMDPVVEADKRLMRVRRELNEQITSVKTARDALRTALVGVDDHRAQAIAALLAKRTVDLNALDQLLADAGSDTNDPLAVAARRVVAVALPDHGYAIEVANELAAAAAQIAELSTTRAGTADQATQVLRMAVAFHDEHGESLCPVCGSGALDAAWRARAGDTLDQLQRDTVAVDQAHRRLQDAQSRAARLLDLDRRVSIDDLEAMAAALDQPEAVKRFRTKADELRTPAAELTPEQLAAHLGAAYPPLVEAFAAVQDRTSAWLRQRHDAWREHAASLQDWLNRARTGVENDAKLKRVNAARDWLRSAITALRDQRFEPFAQRSQEIWDELRQESNVELSGMRLDGINNRRKISFPAKVDGTTTSAMAVMSQGELQALGLSVFLPRACADDSPFRFVIIDDPVQSMDPSKVDGLAQVLAGLAQSRQVVVFTHDNRLPEAIRRLRIEATIWAVTRRDESVIEIRKNSDPIERYLNDATAILKAEGLADNARYPLVSGFCRSALEAACHERIRRERISRGERHGDVEELIEKALTLNQVAALALFGDLHQGGKVLGRLNRFGGWAGDAFQACKQGVHKPGTFDLEVLVRDCRRLVEELR
ncbi:AAA family ATPase [Micromonospora cremea]|uniref:Nuclease SbcCD subunit C n=1 Tax=Micromonospora cremea TaxID=709881 RepID=A0A1N6ANT2_9ACTN|nr:AAA family ATPase [Micromonospora cremea]SIN35677.1 RecF/RecN/SMC N terminal domain-containing protein [Micromonospora cremea]